MINETIKDESASLYYLKKFKFDKHLNYLNKKLKDKTIVIYGAGVFFEAINKHYDLSKLNIIGISDRRFYKHKENETFMGYKVYSIEEVKKLNPNYILVATKLYVKIIEDLLYYYFVTTNIKIKPLVKKPFLNLLKDIWS